MTQSADYNIFANEDATLYICRYLHPDDIVALARAGHTVRAVILPHMQYVVKGTIIIGLRNCIIRRDVIRSRFARVDTTYTIPSVIAVRPDPIPHDYTGVISIRRKNPYIDTTVHEHLWTRAGFIYRMMYRTAHTDYFNIVRITPTYFVEYLRMGISSAGKIDPDAPLIVDIYNTARVLFKDDLSEGFRKYIQFD